MVETFSGADEGRLTSIIERHAAAVSARAKGGSLMASLAALPAESEGARCVSLQALPAPGRRAREVQPGALPPRVRARR